MSEISLHDIRRLFPVIVRKRKRAGMNNHLMKGKSLAVGKHSTKGVLNPISEEEKFKTNLKCKLFSYNHLNSQ